MTNNKEEIEFDVTKLKRLNIDADVQDIVMKEFNFTHPGEAMECGILVLRTLAEAKQQGCNKLYFVKEVDGKQMYYLFDFIKLIECVKSKPNDTDVHKIEFIKPNS
jgi:hypothetical protein